MEQVDLLQSIEEEIYLERASVGVRFLNFLIDFIILRILGFFTLIFLYKSELISPETLSGRTFEDYITLLGIWALLLVVVYTLLEGATGGRTLGKLITGTKAVQDDGTPITWKNAFIRSICRIVPFEPFSALGGYAWHDKWSHTQVIKLRK